MKLVSTLQSGEARLGAVSGNTVIDLQRAAASLARSEGKVAAAEIAAATVPTDAVRFLELGEPAIAAARAAVEHVATLSDADARADLLVSDLDESRLLCPVPKPPKIICVARNYGEHAKEAGFEMSEIPILFARFTETLVAPGDPVVRPKVSDDFDWEGELAVVIGKGGRAISKADALDHVAGYSLFNDCTVRPYQFRVTQYTAGKNFSYSGPFGPYLVTKDEIPDPHTLDLSLTINGETKQSANTGDMFFDVPTIIEHISEFIALEPGDLIPMGTPAGVGFKRKPPEFLKPGDVVSVTIPEIGTLTNPVVAEEDLPA
ncbi:MAG TPA: fumarylacetoacetate hydrolase family protein [Baekduia sp.]|nr:fumarylacetoacetate hydrolase family protein [Baekduia sp.]